MELGSIINLYIFELFRPSIAEDMKVLLRTDGYHLVALYSTYIRKTY